MSSFLWKMGAVIGLVLGVGPSESHAQVANGANKAWQVKYHKRTGNEKTNDVGVRLKIKAVTGSDDLTATLTRYDKTSGSGANERYQKRDGLAGQVELSGRIVKNAGGSGQRKREAFVLTGAYLDEHSTPHVVLIKGFHHTGRSKEAADRTDDQLCIRLIDKAYSSWMEAAHGAAPAPGEPCDEQPPDEDILTEEDVPDTNPPDPPYDGGP